MDVPPRAANPPPQPQRTVYTEDAVQWLNAQGTLHGCSLITSLPDVSEVPPLSLPQWKQWFTDRAEQVMRACPDEGVAIFYQTDIKPDGIWVDKGFLCHQAAERAEMQLLWHKVVCRHAPGTITFGRPAYSHLLCYARVLRMDLGRSTADVLPEAGQMTWTRAMGLNACRVSCAFVLGHTFCRTVVDSFCGQGT